MLTLGLKNKVDELPNNLYTTNRSSQGKWHLISTQGMLGNVDVRLIFWQMDRKGNLLFGIAFCSPSWEDSFLPKVEVSGAAKELPSNLIPSDGPFNSQNARGEARVRDVFYQFDKTRTHQALGEDTLPYTRSLLQSARWIRHHFKPPKIRLKRREKGCAVICFLWIAPRKLSRGEGE